MSIITSNTSNAHRLLNESWEQAKETASETISGLKRTVQENMILSIVLACVVFILLVLCCYLRRKYSRQAQVITQRDYNRLLKKRQERSRQMEEQGFSSNMDKHHDLYLQQENLFPEVPEKEQKKKKKKKNGRKNKQNQNAENIPQLDANSSMETNGTSMTFLSNEEVEYIEDIETGDEGYEVVSPVKPSRSRDWHPQDMFDETEEEEQTTNKKRGLFGKKKDRRPSF